MDPKATLLQCDQAISDGDYPLAVELLNAYYQWRLRDGFQPVDMPSGKHGRGDQFADYCATRLMDHVRETSAIVTAAREVIANWSSGDLAGAVNELESTLPDA